MRSARHDAEMASNLEIQPRGYAVGNANGALTFDAIGLIPRSHRCTLSQFTASHVANALFRPAVSPC